MRMPDCSRHLPLPFLPAPSSEMSSALETPQIRRSPRGSADWLQRQPWQREL